MKIVLVYSVECIPDSKMMEKHVVRIRAIKLVRYKNYWKMGHVKIALNTPKLVRMVTNVSLINAENFGNSYQSANVKSGQNTPEPKTAAKPVLLIFATPGA